MRTTRAEQWRGGKERRLAIGVLVAAIFAVFLVWLMVLDGRLSAGRSFPIDIDAARRLVASDALADRPSISEVEIFATDSVPAAAIQAGADFSPQTMVRTAFRFPAPAGDTIIDVGITRDGGRRFGTAAQFDDAAFARVRAAIDRAAIVAVTHEHPDHIGYLGEHPRLELLAPRLRLTGVQAASLAEYTPGGTLPPAIRALVPIAGDQPYRVAPGVVMLPAPGHTPGSVLFYVSLADGREVLLIGDVAWSMRNIREQRTRPRLAQMFLMQTREDRGAVSSQVRALGQLAASHPKMAIIPSHDGEELARLTKAGWLRRGFGDGE